MNKTDHIKTKLLDFMTKNSAYLIFGAVMLTVITITAASLTSKPDDDDPIAEKTPPAIVQSSPTQRPNKTQTPNKTQMPNTPKPSVTPGQTIPTVTLPPATPEVTPGLNPDNGDGSLDVGGDNTATKTFSIALPFGKKDIITPYSSDTPIYSDTLHEWSCHVGLDFACKENDSVKSAANGIVVQITDDSLYGKSVLVSHSDGFYTLYRGLADVSVTADELVTQGQQIGTAAAAIPFEAHMGTHIHFELIKDDISIDPNKFAQ